VELFDFYEENYFQHLRKHGTENATGKFNKK